MTSCKNQAQPDAAAAADSASIVPSNVVTIGPEKAVSMLSLALGEPRRPVDELIDRLRKPDGTLWAQESLPGLAGIRAEDMTALLSGIMPVDQLMSLKDRCKSRIGSALSVDQGLSALAVYCLTVASARAHFHQHISSQPRPDWDELFVDLSDASPPEWRSMLLAAAKPS